MIKLKKVLLAAFLLTIISFGVSANEVTVDRVDFSKDGRNIMKIENGDISVDVTVTAKEGQKLIFMVALYENGRFKNCRYQSTTAAEGLNALPKISIPVSGTDSKLRVFLFDDELAPLFSSVYLTSDRREAASFYLKKFDALLNETQLTSTSSLYDPVSGGFYYAQSSKLYNPFQADIESTAQMIEYMRETGLLPGMPQTIKDRFITFFQQRQSDEDGYFYDPQFGIDVTDSKRERNFTKTVTVLSWLGAAPLYPTPTERAQLLSAEMPPQYENEAAFTEWLVSLPWDTYPYSAGNTLVSSWITIKAYGYDQIARDYVTSIQNTATGFWGNGLSYDTLNAAMKISGVFDKEHPFPNLNTALNNTVYVAKNCTATTASSIWNVLMFINTAKNTYPEESEYAIGLIDQNLAEITEIILSTVKNFYQADGLYSYLPSGSSYTSQGSIVSLGLPEGDINGNILCTSKMREQAYWLYKISPPGAFTDKREYYFNMLLNAEAVTKQDYYASLLDCTFDDMEKGKPPKGFTTGIQSGSVTVIQDPENISNQCMSITGDSSGATTASVSLGLHPIISKMTFEQRIMVKEAGSPSGRWYVTVGNNAFIWLLDTYNQTGNRAKLTIRRTDSGMGEEVGYINIGEWYNLTIEYIPKGLTDTIIRFYLNGTLIKETSSYYNGGDETKLPANVISGITIGKFSNTGGTLLMDDMHVSLE